MRSAIILSLVLMTGQVMAQDGFRPLEFCKKEKLQTNLCDQLEWGDVSASAANLQNCRARNSANTGQSKCSKGVAAEKERLHINEGKISRKVFSSEELIDSGFGLPIIAERLFHMNGSLVEKETLTKPNDLCVYLGFEKAEKAKINNVMHGDASMLNKAMVVADQAHFLSAIKKISIDNYDFDSKDVDHHVLKVYQEITCVKVVDDQDKLLIKDVETILTYAGEEIGARRLAAQQEREVYNGNRAEKEKEADEVIEHDASISDFLFIPTQSK